MKFTIDGKDVEPICPIYPDDTIEAVQAKLNVGPVYLYAKKRRRVTTRQLYAMFEGGVISRKQVRALLGNIRHLDLESYTYDDLVGMNLDPEALAAVEFPVEREGLEGLLESLQVTRELENSTYTYNDLLDLSLDGTYDMYVSLGQKTPAGVPVKPRDYAGDAESRPERKRVLLEYLPLMDDRVWGVTKVSSPAYLLTASKPYVNLDAVRPDPDKLQVGFTELKCVMDTRYNRLVPLDYAFRLLHASEDAPLLRINSIEPRYRVHAPTKDASGNKIPAVRILTRLSRSGDGALTCVLGAGVVATFRVDGSFEVQSSTEGKTAEELNALYKDRVNPFIAALNSTIQWGMPNATKTEEYYPPFELADARIMTSKLEILTRNVVEGELRIPDGSLLLNVFASDGEGLIYKRVSNFNMYDSAQQILRREGTDAFGSLVRLGLSESEAREALESYADGGARKSATPGIPVQVTKRSDGTLFTLKNVDQLGYIEELKKYITALFQNVAEPEYISEEEYISEDDQEGGGPDVNRQLTNDFFALTRLKTRANVSSKTSKQCLKDKMPIALTEEEYQAISSDATNPDAFNLVETKDGITNAPLHHNGNYYVCPRYWDMAHKVPSGDKFFMGAPMSEKRYKEENGAERLIGVDEEREGYAPEGKDIYEFLKHRENTSGRKYKLVSDKEYKLDPSYGWMTAAVSKKNPVPCCYFPSHIPKDAPTKIPLRVQTAQTGLLKVGSRSAIPTAIATFLGKAPWFRVGVEGSTFLACLASFDDLTAAEVVAVLLKDAEGRFQTLQNGNLPTHFARDMSNQFRKRTAEKNFHEFLKSKDVDFTFLWDLIGLKYNLVIFNGDVADATRVELICPTNYFSQNKFNAKRPTVLMLKQGSGYEPIWQEKEGSAAKKKFQESNFLSKIQKLYATSCAPGRKYSTAETVRAVVRDGVELLHGGKVVGILGKCHVPCYPSAATSAKSMNVQDAPQVKAREAHAYLTEIAAKGVACAPTYQVVVGDRCVGIMVETLQYVPCRSSKILEGVKTYGDVDAEFQPQLEYETREGADPALKRASNRTLEARLYAACRTVLRLALKERKLRAAVLSVVADNKPKSARLYELVKKAIYPKIEFHESIPEQVKWTGGRLNLFKRNLVTGHPNDYVARLADELERFQHLRAYLLDQQTIVDFVVHDLWESELLLSETQWLTYAPKTPANASPHYELNTYDTILSGSVRVGFKVEVAGRMVL